MRMSTKKSVVETELDDAVAEPGNDRPSAFYWLVVGLHLLVLALGSVPIFFYFQRSMELEHYQFFPIAFGVFAYVFYSRWRVGKIRESISGALFSAVLLSMSSAAFVVSIAQYNHYLPTIGVILAIGSLLVCFQDKETDKSLFPVWLLLVPLIRIPLNFDITLITQLQFVSSWIASNILDSLGIANLTPGTVIQVAAHDSADGIKRFDVERACSGVQSLFTLVFCTVAVAVWSRRSFLTGIALVASGIFWSITMNSVRIVICVAFYYWFDFDVYSGFKHEILGYMILFAAIGLIASTDAVFGFLFGAVDTANGSRNWFAKIWNRYVAGVDSAHGRRKKSSGPSAFQKKFSRRVLISSLVVVNICGALVIATSISGGEVRGTVKIGELAFESKDLPIEIRNSTSGAAGWISKSNGFENIVRNANSTYGPYSSSWIYSSLLQNPSARKKNLAQVSLDYTFLGWHELKVCYQAQGWKIERSVVPDSDWKSVEMTMKTASGESAFCVFSIFDYQGEPLEPFSDDVGFFLLRLRNRISREFSTTSTFQVQCFVQQTDPFTGEELDEIRQLHKTTRELLKTKVLEKIATVDDSNE